MLLSHIANDGVVKFVARDLYGIGQYRAAQGKYCHVACAAADIQYHAAARGGNIYARAYGSRYRLLNKISMACAGLFGGVYYGTLFNFGNPGGYADHYTGLEEYPSAHYLAEEVVQKALGYVVVGYYAVAQRAHGDYVAGGAAYHAAGFFAYCKYVAGYLFYRNNGRLPQHYSLASHIDKDARSAKVNAYIAVFQKSHFKVYPPQAKLSLRLLCLRIGAHTSANSTLLYHSITT